MKDYNSIEKAGMMGLQTLVGFSRWKENLKGTAYEEGENGEKIYLEKISTITHGVNLKTLRMIEELGYIRIDSMEEKFRANIVDDVLRRKPREMKTLLIPEKIGFKNYADLRKIALATLEGDKATLEQMKQSFQKVTFRLTDKEINFEELYQKPGNISEVKDKKERIALRRLAIIFDNQQGILATKKIDIAKDRFGRDMIWYDTQESLGERIAKSMETIKNTRENFRAKLAENVNKKGLEQRAIESLEKKEIQEKTEIIK